MSPQYELKKAHQENNLKAFFATNVLGFCGDLDNIRDFCTENSIIFLEDNCEGLGSELAFGEGWIFWQNG